MRIEPWPKYAVWDITYACPLRCSHCYSESGRRPSRQLGRDDLMRVVHALTSMKLEVVVLSGGEPLLVKEIFEVAQTIAQSGAAVHLYTGGWNLDQAMVERLMQPFQRVAVSLDGADAEAHDRIRGRTGSFERATRALTRLDEAIGARRARGQAHPWLGIEYTVIRSNLQQIARVCREVVPRFPHLDYITFGAVIPSGLATRPSFAEHELLTEAQARDLVGADFQAQLRAMVPPTVSVSASDNRGLQLHPDNIAQGIGIPGMQIEADGEVRAMSSYEGTVGNLLEEAPEVLWERAVSRWRDPFVVDTITPARTYAAWAEATHSLDLRFGSAVVRERIQRRLPYFAGEEQSSH